MQLEKKLAKNKKLFDYSENMTESINFMGKRNPNVGRKISMALKGKKRKPGVTGSAQTRAGSAARGAIKGAKIGAAIKGSLAAGSEAILAKQLGDSNKDVLKKAVRTGARGVVAGAIDGAAIGGAVGAIRHKKDKKRNFSMFIGTQDNIEFAKKRMPISMATRRKLSLAKKGKKRKQGIGRKAGMVAAAGAGLAAAGLGARAYMKRKGMGTKSLGGSKQPLALPPARMALPAGR